MEIFSFLISVLCGLIAEVPILDYLCSQFWRVYEYI